ncbi:hypothetical protein COY00_00630 [Candidatus Pacearchaeota archaeon CG_4_10_14_0_2_um_filter_35_33]|nr:DUF2341 domain-containing protein [Candidatus Pacearchaeota archaeon]PIZ80615.1 MAG: hypothetical protein COY00_00630 [Candidatus Pacearchaeota archaeon CG_4_10_14_0_2_um_filter_35_33]PJB93838.1 MAG: hypothetical protein CO081_03980 [Candidatus Pacearchaeota archaeon CG_4_9_14_0_8_um_filter_35_24]
MKNSLLKLQIILCLILFSISFVSAAWWDTDWAKRQEINISNTDSAQTNYQTKINIAYDSDMQVDFSDLRFTNSSNSPLDYWLQEIVNSTSVTAWVEVDSLKASDNTTIYMYYNNANVNTTSNGTATFLLFDDFDDGTIDTNIWTEIDQAGGDEITEHDGSLWFARDTNDVWDKAVYSDNSFTRSNLSFEFDYWWRSNNAVWDALMMGWKDDGTGVSYANFVYAYYNNGGSGSDTSITQIVYEDANLRGNLAGHTWDVNESYDVRIQMKSAGGAFYDYSTNNGSSWTNAYDSSYSTESTLHVGWPFYSGTHEFDNARVRQWMTNEPTISFGSEEQADITPPIITLNEPVSEYNTSSQTINFNFTAIEDFTGDINCSLYIDSTYQTENATTQNNTLTNLQASSISHGSHNWSISCTDGSSNTNSSSNRSFYVDIQGPSFSNIVYSPNSSDSVDPNTNLTFNSTVADDRMSIDTVILQYYNGSGWANSTMLSPDSDGNYNTTILLVSSEQNYAYNIWANDSLGNANQSTNQTFASEWDCTWSVSPSSLEEVTGFFEDKKIGNITITNTGDAEYSNNNCSVTFTNTYTGFSGAYWSQTTWASNERGLSFDSTTIVNASSNGNLTISASFPSVSSPLTETPTIKLTADINDSVTNNKSETVSTTIIISPPNPLLFQKMEYPDPDSVPTFFLKEQNITLGAYTRNIGGDGTEDNTARNVSFNWTLPSWISDIVVGNQTNFYDSLTDNSKQYNNLTLELNSSTLTSAQKGTFNLTIYSWGYDNSTGDFEIIINSGNQTTLNQTGQLIFACYSESDNICVTSCGVGADPDCTESSGDSSDSSSGGGGGGGGGNGAKSESIETRADFQLIRGEQNEVKIIFGNKDKNESLKDLTFSVSGKIAKYIEINPKKVSYLDPKQEITITLIITSPTYVELGKQELTITMKGKKGTKDYTDSKKITLEIHELSVERAKEMLKELEELIKKLEEINLSSQYLENLLNESYEAMGTFNLELVRDNYNIIKEQINYALDSVKIIEELESLISSAEEKGIDVSQSARLLKLAKLSIERKEFEQAYSRVKDTQLTYALEVKGEFGKLSYYLKEYPGELSLGALFLVIFSFGSYKIKKLRKIKIRIKELKDEEKILNELIRILQKECFKDKKMSMEEYENTMKEYNKKLSQTVEELIELETKRVHILGFTSKNKLLITEKNRIIDLIKELQSDYMKKKKLETRTFELKMESFNKKLSEIEEKLATLEAKTASKSWGISLKVPKE